MPETHLFYRHRECSFAARWFRATSWFEIELVHRRSTFGKVSGRALVEGKLAAEAVELFAIADRRGLTGTERSPPPLCIFSRPTGQRFAYSVIREESKSVKAPK